MASYLRGQLLAPEQVAQFAYQAGFRGEDLVHIVGLATQRESGNESTNFHSYAGAHRTSTNNYGAASGDLGLMQINWGSWGDQLIQAGIIRTHTDLFDPATNMRAAKFVLDHQGWAAWGAGAGGWQAGGDSWYGVSKRGAAEAAVAKAQSNGMVAADANTGGNTAAGAAGALPRDAILVDYGSGTVALFNVGGVYISYTIPNDGSINLGGRPVARMTRDAFIAKYKYPVSGGSAEELADIPTAFGTYAAYTTAILDQLFPRGDPRRDDPEIMRVLATRAGRPDMTEAEFENLLKATTYYQSRTEGQLRWNDLSEAERKVQRDDMEARMLQTVLSLTGSEASRVGGTAGGFVHNNTIKAHVEAVASGRMSYSTWTEQIVKPFAAKRPESPWSRQLRDEQESQRQRPIDIENTVGRIRDTAAEWGIPMSEATLRSWATGIVTNTKSDDDLMNYVKAQAKVMYPTKDPEMATNVWAAPWIETYNRVLERQGSLETPEIARALAGYGRDPDNHDPWSFEQRLKMTDDYDQTRQGADDAYSTTAELAGLMGF